VCWCFNIGVLCANIQQPGQSYSYEPSGYASSSLGAAPSAAGYAQSELGQPQYAVQGIYSQFSYHHISKMLNFAVV